MAAVQAAGPLPMIQTEVEKVLVVGVMVRVVTDGEVGVSVSANRESAREARSEFGGSSEEDEAEEAEEEK